MFEPPRLSWLHAPRKKRAPETTMTGVEQAKPTHLNQSCMPQPNTHSPAMSGSVSTAPKIKVNFQAATGELAEGSAWQLLSSIGDASYPAAFTARTMFSICAIAPG